MPSHYLENELSNLFKVDEDMWTFVQQASLDGVWYWDLERPDNLWISPEYWHCLGYDPATKKHSPEEFAKAVFDEDLPNVMSSLERHYSDPSVPYEEIVRFHHADGSIVWVRCRGKATRDESGKAIRMLGAHNDLSAIKMAESELISANEELANFAYSLSHDLKSPTNTVQMLIDEVIACDEGGLSAEQRDLLAMSQKTIGHMRGQVDSLLSYTRIIGDEMTKESLDLNTLVNDVLENIRAIKDGAEAEVQVNMLPIVSGNKFQLFVLLQNLLENVIKYRRTDKPLVVVVTASTDTESEALVVSISDNGIGIAPEHRDHVFKMFKRLHRQDEFSGVGLGLSLCRKIMNNHKGRISLVSNDSGGTTVNLFFPRHPDV